MSDKIIWGTTSGLKTMVDDTVRIQIDINPEFFDAACKQFGKRGIEVALAQLVQGATLDHINEEPEPEPEEEKPARNMVKDFAPEKMKGGKLSILAAMLGQDETFRTWFEDYSGHSIDCSDECRRVIYVKCNISSRRELDHDPDAAAAFHKIRKAYVKFQDE